MFCENLFLNGNNVFKHFCTGVIALYRVSSQWIVFFFSEPLKYSRRQQRARVRFYRWRRGICNFQPHTTPPKNIWRYLYRALSHEPRDDGCTQRVVHVYWRRRRLCARNANEGNLLIGRISRVALGRKKCFDDAQQSRVTRISSWAKFRNYRNNGWNDG